ncbi:MAG: hypothetical protein JXA73_03870 [Acidobacteria bacterium]|nr:hypothetical protein [Acidobacteriota bacterium]
MLLIAAALEEELRTAMDLCCRHRKFPNRSLSLWHADRGEKTIGFLQSGVGPKRSAARLEEALKWIEASHVLVIGYAGALDPVLRVGDLVAVARASAFSLPEDNAAWENVRLEGAFDLTESEMLAWSAGSLGLKTSIGDALTSSYVLGNPAHKSLLFGRFHASIVDMETAAFARIAASRNVPLSCIRAISDEANDAFLEPFSHDPSKTMVSRAGKLIDRGMVKTYRKWKTNSRKAQESLKLFLEHYL